LNFAGAHRARFLFHAGGQKNRMIAWKPYVMKIEWEGTA
jgi:hypothetical protein